MPPIVPLTAPLVEAFAGVFLSPRYDDAKATPAFHREGWELYCSEAPLAAVVAPRGHAKSTAFTHDFALAAVLFRWEPHVLIVSATEKLSLAHLADISTELHENEDLRAEFGIKEFVVDSKGEIVVKCDDGYMFRLIAAGSGQRLRGLKWNGRRPGLILCDDMEEDEQVESKDQRDKFSRWVLRALLPIGRRGARIRWHGTILHTDAFLARIMKSKSWKHLFYKAHEAFDDFTNILWPEQFNAESLKFIRQTFLDDPDQGAAGYSQEYLNNPLEGGTAYLRKEDFLPMGDEDFDKPQITAVGCDFAISKKDKANRTSFTVGGKCVDNLMHVKDQYVGRMDSLEIVDLFFDVQARHNPDIFFVEGGQIWLAIWPMLKREMQKRDKWLNIDVRQPITDKASRGRSFQRRMRAGGCRYNKDTDWYPGYQEELLRFTGTSEAALDDQFDSTALLSLGFDTMAEVEEEDLMEEEELDMIQHDPRKMTGRSSVTGY